jgi:hypothetical protein
VPDPLHLVKVPLRPETLASIARRRGLLLRDLDDGYLLNVHFSAPCAPGRLTRSVERGRTVDQPTLKEKSSQVVSVINRRVCSPGSASLAPARGRSKAWHIRVAVPQPAEKQNASDSGTLPSNGRPLDSASVFRAEIDIFNLAKHLTRASETIRAPRALPGRRPVRGSW